jgi:hypothetical protein
MPRREAGQSVLPHLYVRCGRSWLLLLEPYREQQTHKGSVNRPKLNSSNLRVPGAVF